MLALRTALQARRGGLVVPPAAAAAPNMLGNANAAQDGTLLALPFQPYRIQARNFLFSDLAVRYPAINESLFKAISENTMEPINILKLSTDYTPEREKMKVLKVNSTLAVDTLEEDALLSEVKGPAHLIRCFLLYCTVLLHFTPFGIRYDLTIGLHAYLGRFLGFTLLYTWDSVKSFHFIFHRARMSEGIADGMGWSRANTHLKSLHLVRKISTSDTHTAGPKRTNAPTFTQRYQPYQQTMSIQSGPCYRYNAGAACNGDVCKFGHVLYALCWTTYRTSMPNPKQCQSPRRPCNSPRPQSPMTINNPYCLGIYF